MTMLNQSHNGTYLVSTATLGYITIPVSLVGVCSSTLCLWFLWKHVKEEKPTTTLLYVNLSVATLLFCGIVCPVHAYTQIVQLNSTFAQNTATSIMSCRFFGFFYFWTLTASGYSHSAIAANRFLIVVFSGRHLWLSSLRVVSFLIVISWLLAGFTFTWPLLSLGGTFGFSTESMKCTFASLSSSAYVNFFKIMYGFVPAVVMVICYTAVFITVATSKGRLVSRGSSVRQVQPGQKRNLRAEAKVTRVAFVTCLVFLVSNTPSAIFGIVVTAKSTIQSVPGMALVFFMWIGCAVSPLLYIYLSSDLRRRINDYAKRRFPHRFQLAQIHVAPDAKNGSSLSRSATWNTKSRKEASVARSSSTYRKDK